MEDGIPPFLDELPPPPGEGLAALLPTIGLALGIALVVGLLIYLLVHLLRRPSPPPPLPEHLKIAREELITLLAQIRSPSPPSPSKVGARVSSTIRTYLGSQLATPLLPRTTQEIDRAASLASLAGLPDAYLPLARRCDALTFGAESLPVEGLASLVDQAIETISDPSPPDLPGLDLPPATARGESATP